MRSIKSLLLLSMFSLLLVQQSMAKETVTLHWVGCGISKKAYLTELAKAYEQQTGVHIDIQGGGATRGIRDVASLSADIGGSCRNRIFGEPRETGVTMVPVAWDALVVIVHPDNPVSDISLENLRNVYLGKITNWKELGGPDKPLKLFVRKGKISGVGRTARKLLFNNYDQEFVATEIFDSSGPLEKQVQADPEALAISGISSARKRNVKLLSLNGKQPTYDNVKSGEYLLYRTLYLSFNKNNPHLDQVKNFIHFAQSAKGMDIIRSQGTVPYIEAMNLMGRKLRESKASKSSSGIATEQ